MSQKNLGCIISTTVLMGLNKDAQKRNRAINTDWLTKNVDPDGWHVITQILFHNDVEWRCQVLIKVKDSMEPAICWIDVSPENWVTVEMIDAAIRKSLDESQSEATL